MFRFMFLTLFIVFNSFLAACSRFQPNAPQPAPSIFPPDQSVTSTEPEPGIIVPGLENPYSPQETDHALQRDTVLIESKDLLVLESFPPQYMLALKGTLPTPCHELRVVIHEPDAKNRINVEVYSVVDPKAACILIVAPLDATIRLDSFPAGKYNVLVNGELVGEMDVPDSGLTMKCYELSKGFFYGLHTPQGI